MYTFKVYTEQRPKTNSTQNFCTFDTSSIIFVRTLSTRRT